MGQSAQGDRSQKREKNAPRSEQKATKTTPETGSETDENTAENAPEDSTEACRRQEQITAAAASFHALAMAPDRKLKIIKTEFLGLIFS